MKFIIPGKPFGKMRPRRSKFGMYDPKQNKDFEEKVRKAYFNQQGHIPEPTDKPVWININLLYPIPARTPKKTRDAMLNGKIMPIMPTVKPDVDNCAKSIMDALNGIYYLDDKQVTLLRVEKRYGEKPMIIVEIGRYY